MAGLVLAARTRSAVTAMFVAFLLVNVILLTLAMIAAAGRTVPEWAQLDLSAAVGLRLLLVAIGAVGSWFIARVLYKMLVRGGVPPSDSVGPALALVSYLVLLMAAYAFFTFGAWVWLPVLLLILLVWSVVVLSSLVGMMPVLLAVCVAVAGGVLAWLMFA